MYAVRLLPLVAIAILWNVASSSVAEEPVFKTVPLPATGLSKLGPGLPVASLYVLPGNFTLHGPACRQLLVLERRNPDQFVGQIAADEVAYHSGNEKVVRIENGTAIPVADGTTTITAKHASGTASVQVKVVDMAKPFQWSFRNHVESVLLKTGCTTGPCHGAQSGKGGFKLSLRGYDPEGDFIALTRQARGRRITPTDPGRSLILTKPTGAVAHKGGLRFRVDSLEYKILSDWIAAGTPAPKPDDARIERIQILPENVVLKKNDSQQLIVLAHFSDGRVEDVTRWTLFTSANESAVQIDQNGLAKTVGYGEGALTAWYLSKVTTSSITVPMEKPAPEAAYTAAPERNFIDKLVLEKLKSLGIPPSPQSTDGEFIRRVYLDTLGILPTVEETKHFVADQSPGKRDRLIEAVLDRPEFVDYWAYRWSDLLLVNGDKLGFGNRDNANQALLWSYYSWVRNHVEADTPWDQMVRELMTASGSNLENGASNFYLLHQDPLDMAETTTVAFLGLNINCARCHNHPLEKWSNDQYYAMANLFARVRVKQDAGGKSSVVFADMTGDLIQPLTGKPRPPTPLDGTPLALDDPKDRRVHLAAWLTSPTNPYFARSITNRVWANFFGRGLVEPVDDLRLTNPPSNPELLDAAAKYLVEQKFQLKSLMRVILQSAAYQRSSMPLAANELDDRFYSRYYPKRLMAEVLLDATSGVTAQPSKFPGFPDGYRALQLPSSSAASYFLSTFGRPDRLVTCACERNDQPTMVQVLHITNGETVNTKLAAKDNALGKALAAGKTDAEVLDQLFLHALSRLPTAAEKDRVVQELAAARGDDKRKAWEDVYWSVLSSKEFLFNH